MSARDYGDGAHHAPAAHELDRAPLTQADDYTAAPARVCADAWDYEAQRDADDARWTATAGRRRGGEQRAAVLRTPRGAA